MFDACSQLDMSIIDFKTKLNNHWEIIINTHNLLKSISEECDKLKECYETMGEATKNLDEELVWVKEKLAKLKVLANAYNFFKRIWKKV